MAGTELFPQSPIPDYSVSNFVLIKALCAKEVHEESADYPRYWTRAGIEQAINRAYNQILKSTQLVTREIEISNEGSLPVYKIPKDTNLIITIYYQGQELKPLYLDKANQNLGKEWEESGLDTQSQTENEVKRYIFTTPTGLTDPEGMYVRIYPDPAEGYGKLKMYYVPYLALTDPEDPLQLPTYVSTYILKDLAVSFMYRQSGITSDEVLANRYEKRAIQEAKQYHLFNFAPFSINPEGRRAVNEGQRRNK